MANVSFRYGTRSAYDSITPDVSTLYFISDTHEIFKGSDLVSINNVSRVTTLPDVSIANKDILYIKKNENNEFEIYILSEDNSSFEKISGTNSKCITSDSTNTLTNKTIDANDNNITNLDISNFAQEYISKIISEENASENKLVTEKAVSDYVNTIKTNLSDEFNEKINEKGDPFVSLSTVIYDETENPDKSGKFGLKFVTANNQEVIVDLDKEKFLKSATLSENGKNLILTLTDDSTVDIDLTELVANAKTVKTTSEITLTTSWGNLKAGDKINADTSIEDLLLNALCKDINPTVTNPSVSVKLNNAGSYEVGTKVTPSYTVTYNDGSYKLAGTGINKTTNANCVLSSVVVTDTNSGSYTGSNLTGSFNEITVNSNTNYSVSAKANYAESTVTPLTYLGKEYSSVKISSGTTSISTSSKITGYRNGFYGTLTDKTGAINSSLVRSLTGKTGKTPAVNNTFSISIPVGAMRIVFAYPSSLRDVSSVKDVNGMNAEINSAFTKYEIQVEGANGFDSISYKVYVYDLANANDTVNTYKVTI